MVVHSLLQALDHLSAANKMFSRPLRVLDSMLDITGLAIQLLDALKMKARESKRNRDKLSCEPWQTCASGIPHIGEKLVGSLSWRRDLTYNGPFDVCTCVHVATQPLVLLLTCFALRSLIGHLLS